MRFDSSVCLERDLDLATIVCCNGCRFGTGGTMSRCVTSGGDSVVKGFAHSVLYNTAIRSSVEISRERCGCTLNNDTVVAGNAVDRFLDEPATQALVSMSTSTSTSISTPGDILPVPPNQTRTRNASNWPGTAVHVSKA